MEYFILNAVLILRYVEDNFAEKAKRDLQYLCWGQLRQPLFCNVWHTNSTYVVATVITVQHVQVYLLPLLI
jgi:hypothetical protein